MAEIKWTAEAEKWLHDIYDYIAQDNSDAALGVVSGIYQRHSSFAIIPKWVIYTGKSLREKYESYCMGITGLRIWLEVKIELTY